MYSLVSFVTSLFKSTVVFLALTVMGSVAFCGQVAEIHKDCATLSAPGRYPDYEPTPNYHIERREYGRTKPPTLLLRISVPTEALNSGSMTRLACKLASDFREEGAIDALIFDDRRAAQSFAPGFTDQHHYGTYLWHLRARFELDRTRKRQFIEFLVPEVEDGLLGLRRYRISISRD